MSGRRGSSHGFPRTAADGMRVDNLRVPAGVAFIDPNGLRRSDVSPELGPAETLDGRRKRWGLLTMAQNPAKIRLALTMGGKREGLVNDDAEIG